MDGIAAAAAVMAALGWVGLGALYLFVVRSLQAQAKQAQAKSEAADEQWRNLTTRLERLEERLQATGGRPTDHGAAGSVADEMKELRRELDYLKSRLSTLLTPPETPPHPLPGLAAAPHPSPPPGAAAPPPAAAFENQRVSDIVARYRGRLRTGHIDALTRHFSVNPTGLFLELEERGERLVFPAQEIVYAGDFEQNYRFVFDCAEPGGGYVVVLSPARLDAQGRVVARGRLRIE